MPYPDVTPYANGEFARSELNTQNAAILSWIDEQLGVNVMKHGATPLTEATVNDNTAFNAAADSTQAFKDAHDAAVTLGTYVTAPRGARFKVGRIQRSTSPRWNMPGVSLYMNTAHADFGGSTTSQATWLEFSGSQGTKYNLTASTAQNAISVTVSSANATSMALVAGDLVLIGSAYLVEPSFRTDEYWGQMVEVESVNTGTGVITLREPLNRAINIAEPLGTYGRVPFIQKITPIENPELIGLRLVNRVANSTNFRQVRVAFARNAKVDLEHVNGDSMGTQLVNVFRFDCKIDAKDLKDNLGNGQYGYGLATYTACCHGTVYLRAENCRHGFTTAGGATWPVTRQPSGDGLLSDVAWGEPNNITVWGTATGCSNGAFDVHPHGWNVTFSGCVATGNPGAAFMLRGTHCKVDGGIAATSSCGVSIGDVGDYITVNGLDCHDIVRAYATVPAELGGPTGCGQAIRINPVSAKRFGYQIRNCTFNNIAGQVVSIRTTNVSTGGIEGFEFAMNSVGDFGTVASRYVIQTYQPLTKARIHNNVVKTAQTSAVFLQADTTTDNWGNLNWGDDCAAWDNEWDVGASGIIIDSPDAMSVKWGRATTKGMEWNRIVVVGNERQVVTVTGTPTGGTFTLTYNGQTTAGIAYNASAATVQAALEALSNIGVGEAVCSGGPLGGTLGVAVDFSLTLGLQDVPQMTANPAGLTGGTSPSVVVRTVLPGSPPFDASRGDRQTIILTRSIASSTLVGGVVGQVLRLRVQQDATGARTFVWPTNIYWGQSAALNTGAPTVPSAASSGITVSLEFDGTNWREVGRT